MADREQELKRARDEYDRRDASVSLQRSWSILNPLNVIMLELRELQVMAILANLHKDLDLNATRFLDVGCGTGAEFLRLLAWGVRPELCCGIDLSKTRIAAAGERLPETVDLRSGSADQLPWANDSFDVVTQYTLMSSVLDAELRRGIAAEMTRTLAPDGLIVWYDMRRDGLATRSKWRSVKSEQAIHWFAADEICDLFPMCTVEFSTATLAPWIGRRALRIGRWFYCLLETIPALRSHHLAVIRQR